MSGVSILMYHQVGPFEGVAGHRALVCDVRRFAAQMAYLHRFGYPVLSMDEVSACLRGERPIPDRAVALTFDDGYENFYEYALPILRSHGFTATVYVVANLVGRHAEWLEADGLPQPALMDAARLREIHTAGITVGAHACDHIRLAGLAPAALRHQVGASRHALEDLLGAPVRHFCYPYGSHDLPAVEAAATAGYDSAVTCQRALATPDFDPLALPRKAISYGDNLLGYFWKLHVKNAPKGSAVRRKLRPTLAA